jgi:hypothetical protein
MHVRKSYPGGSTTQVARVRLTELTAWSRVRCTGDGARSGDNSHKCRDVNHFHFEQAGRQMNQRCVSVWQATIRIQTAGTGRDLAFIAGAFAGQTNRREIFH